MLFIDIIKKITDKYLNNYGVLIENFAFLSILQVVVYILPLITLPYLVRVLGVEKYGLIAFASSFITYFQIITDYGFCLSATREVSVHRDDKNKVSEIFSSVMIIKLGLLGLSLVLMLTILHFFEYFLNEWKLYVFTFMTVIGTTLFPVWFFQGIERMRYITILNITSNLIFTILIFVFIKHSTDYIYVPLISSLGMIVSGSLALWIIITNFKIVLFIPKRQIMIDTLKDSTQFFLSRASVSIYTSSNTFFLGLFTSTQAVGYYSAAEKLYIAAQALYQPMIQVIYPFVSKNKNRIFYKSLFKYVFFINSIFCIILFFNTDKLINMLYGSGFQESILVLKIFCVGLFVVIPSILLGYPFLGALGFQRYANASVIFGSIFHLFALIIISKFFLSIYSVAVLVILTELLVLSVRIYGINKHKLWS